MKILNAKNKRGFQIHHLPHLNHHLKSSMKTTMIKPRTFISTMLPLLSLPGPAIFFDHPNMSHVFITIVTQKWKSASTLSEKSNFSFVVPLKN